MVLDAAETNQDFQIVREAVEEFETLVSEKEKPNAAITKYIHDVMELPAECMQRKEKD